MTEPVDLREFLAGFHAEADEILRAANADLLAIEVSTAKGSPSPRAVRDLYRALHTLKGLAGMVGVDPIVDLAHAMETVVRVADRQAGRLSNEAVELCLQGLKAIEDRVRQVAAGKTVAGAPAGLLAGLSALDLVAPVTAQRDRGPPAQLAPELFAKLSPAEHQQLAEGLAAGRRAFVFQFVPSPARAAQGLTITTIRERVGEVSEIVKVVPRSMKESAAAPAALAFDLLVLTDVSDEVLAAAGSTTPAALRAVSRDPGAAPTEATLDPGPGPADLQDSPDLGDPGDGPPAARGAFVRVEVSRLDDAMERLSALIVTRFRLQREIRALTARGADVRGLSEIDALHGRQLRDLRAAIIRARMVPVTELFARIPLLVRGLTRDSGKEVRLEIDARGAELDKTVGDRIFPAIVHLTRNAVDHAIETPAERERLGKPREGTIRIHCQEQANNQLELTLSDDGRGIDAAMVAQRAGKDPPHTAAALLELLATPGFSTLDVATSTSGRGLGMDIIRRIVTIELGGVLILATELGVGTTFTLRLPLSMTIVDVFSFRCGPQVFVAPVASIEEIIEVEPARKVRGPAPHASAASAVLYERRGQALPLIELDALLRLGRTADPARQGLVVRRDGEMYTFQIDRVLGRQEVVVRPIEDPLVQSPGVVGTTDLGDGRPTLVLDLIGLSAHLRGALQGSVE